MGRTAYFVPREAQALLPLQLVLRFDVKGTLAVPARELIHMMNFSTKIKGKIHYYNEMTNS